MIADDLPVILHGITCMTHQETNITTTGCFTQKEPLYAALKKDLPDVLIMMARTGSMYREVRPYLKEKHRRLKLLTLVNPTNEIKIRFMLDDGFGSYLSHACEPQQLIEAINTVHTDGIYIDPAIMYCLLPAPGIKIHLTGREQQILQLIAKGCSTKEIADQISLSQRTIEKHRIILIQKLQTDNTITMVRKALKAGLVQ